MTADGVLLLVAAIVTSLLATWAARTIAPRLGMLDWPDTRRVQQVHATPVARNGGWGLVLGALLPAMLFLPLNGLIQSYLLGVVILFVFGAWDDARGIGHYKKFLSQIIAAGLIVYYGDLWIERMPYVGAVPAAFGKPFTIFAIVGVINAINHADGLDGLAAGQSLLSLAVIGLLASGGHDSYPVVVLCIATAGAIVGFMHFNSHPASIFMGDTGSQFLGFTLGFLAVYLTQITDPTISAALPLVFIGLPIIDILAVLGQRIYNGMNWFKATRNHIHHRLLDRGFDHSEAVMTIYIVQAVMVSSAVVLQHKSDWTVTGWYLCMCATVFAMLILAERKGWYVRSSGRKHLVDR